MSVSRLLSGRLLARNVVWNLLGTGFPLLVALWAIPALVKGMGTERFGLLSIIWMGVGYFSLFDLGIGRALTKLVAERLGNRRIGDLPSVTSTGLKLMFVLGICAGLVVASIAPWFAHSVLNVPQKLYEEAVYSFWILSATLPFVVSNAGQIGVLQAHQRFSRINAVRAPLGVMTFLGPALALTVTPSLVATTLVLASARLLAWFAYRHFCRSFLGGRVAPRLNKAHARELLGFGVWITVSNVVGPLMVYFDRFLIGAMLTLSAVAYYTTPYEVVTRLLFFPEALAGVLFPALTTSLVADSERASKIFATAVRVSLVFIFPIVGLVVLFASEALTLWLGTEFARQSAPVLRWLAVGVLVNCFARLPLITLQGSGRPDLTAKVHLAELIPYMLLLWGLVRAYGIVGAAIAWTLRIVVDTTVLFYFSMKVAPHTKAVQAKALLHVFCATSIVVCLLALQPLWLKVTAAIFIVVICFAVALHEMRILIFHSHNIQNGKIGNEI